MKKNLIFLTLLISVLMVSVVSAGITGYLTRGRTLATDGYTATLTGVEGTTAIVSVATPDGDTKVVRVPEGQTAIVGEAEISASNLRQGNLFTRGGAEVEINAPTSEKASPTAKIATGGKVYSHYHVTSPLFFGPTFFQELKGWGQTDPSFPTLNPSPSGMVSATRINDSTPIYNGSTLLGNRFEQDIVCPEGASFLVEGGYNIIYDYNNYVLYPDNYEVLSASPVDLKTYHLSVFQSANAKTKINYIDVNIICAELEGAEYQNTAHFPPNI